MKNTLQLFFLTIAIYLCVCACTIFFITPYSFTSFIGPAAGITTALVIFWGTGILLAIAIATILFCLYLFLLIKFANRLIHGHHYFIGYYATEFLGKTADTE